MDDHKVNVKLLGKKIEMMFENIHDGVQVLSAADGLAALQVLTTVRDDEAKHNATGSLGPTIVVAGVFIDYHMPNIDGAECTSRVRLLEAEKGWPR